MDALDVGRFRYCPACGRSLLPPATEAEDPDSEAFDWEEPRCSCCDRPWIACPCTPVEEGECRAEGAV